VVLKDGNPMVMPWIDKVGAAELPHRPADDLRAAPEQRARQRGERAIDAVHRRRQ